LEKLRDMTNMAIPLRDLGQRISEQQTELEKLRREYEARRTQAGDLTRRKEQLQAQLRQVEEQLQRIDAGTTPPQPTPAATPAPKPATKPPKKVSLARVLVEIVSTAGRAMTVKELTQEVVKRKYPTTSANLPQMIKSRVSALVKKKLLRRAQNQPGVLPIQQPAMPQGPATKVRKGAKPDGAKAAAAKKPATAAAPGGITKRLTLPAAVMQVLAQSSRPLVARELAEKVLESGYQTKSQDFTKVVWGALGDMATIEHVKGKGYRLKKAKGAK